MIIFRYLTREILITMAAVAGVLLLVIMGNRFIHYFTDVAQGDFPARLLGTLMLYQLPNSIQLLLPLAFFLAIMLTYGQLYLNSEITVLMACGVSPRKLLHVTLWPAGIVAVLVGACSLWLTPAGLVHNESMLDDQKQNADFSTLTPGRFQELGDLTVYAESISGDASGMQNLLIAEQEEQANGPPRETLTRAQSGYQANDPETGSRYLVLDNGYRYSVVPGNAASDRLQFETYAIRLAEAATTTQYDDVELLSTPALLASDDLEALGALQWRSSLPLMVLILTLIALPLSRANPRQGRFAKLLPAIFIYISYMSLLLAAQDAISGGRLPVAVGMWPIHGFFLLIGVWLISRGGALRGRS
ncbi:LPS export ABC transporter permease LptF [Salinicola sp. V024]|uniref:LPS export ABC transporter permease LptF n=1 Tax=Salinicola sp. V024 TaxID=3459609 RepID=UPI004044C5FA